VVFAPDRRRQDRELGERDQAWRERLLDRHRAERTADGGDSMTLTDIVIVDGEETRAPKRLCRPPPANRYARA
jgi:hypothetical protein